MLLAGNEPVFFVVQCEYTLHARAVIKRLEEFQLQLVSNQLAHLLVLLLTALAMPSQASIYGCTGTR